MASTQQNFLKALRKRLKNLFIIFKWMMIVIILCYAAGRIWLWYAKQDAPSGYTMSRSQKGTYVTIVSGSSKGFEVHSPVSLYWYWQYPFGEQRLADQAGKVLVRYYVCDYDMLCEQGLNEDEYVAWLSKHDIPPPKPRLAREAGDKENFCVARFNHSTNAYRDRRCR